MNDREQESEATIVHVLEIDGDSSFDHGEHPVFWRYVRQQLDELASLDHPWVVGTVVKLTRAYSIAAPTREQLTAGLRAVEAWQSQTRAGTEPR